MLFRMLPTRLKNSNPVRRRRQHRRKEESNLSRTTKQLTAIGGRREGHQEGRANQLTSPP